MRDGQRVALRDAGAGEFSIAGGLNRYMKWPYCTAEIPNFTGYWTKDLAEGTWIDQSDPRSRGSPASSRSESGLHPSPGALAHSPGKSLRGSAGYGHDGCRGGIA